MRQTSLQGPLKKNEKKLARFFNLTFRYIDDVLSLNNSRFGEFVDRIYPIELEIKDTTDTSTHLLEDRGCHLARFCLIIRRKNRLNIDTIYRSRV